MELSILVERVIGLMYFSIGMSLLIRPGLWMELIEEIIDNSHIRTYLMTFVALPMGIITISVHNIWEWSPALIVTIFGWAALLKGCIHLFFPGLILKLIPPRRFLRKVLVAEGILLMILCIFVIFHSFQI